MLTKEGIIQRIKSDRKALSLLGIWYNSFKPLDDSINVGDNIKLTYTVKGQFKNIKSIEPIKEESESTNEPLLKRKLNDVVIDTLIMQSVQHSLNKNIPLKKATEEIIDSFNLIINL